MDEFLKETRTSEILPDPWCPVTMLIPPSLRVAGVCRATKRVKCTKWWGDNNVSIVRGRRRRRGRSRRGCQSLRRSANQRRRVMEFRAPLGRP
ncbi:hypothetical protein LSAT2_008366, partial [Lamellibrachia satsuma]